MDDSEFVVQVRHLYLDRLNGRPLPTAAPQIRGRCESEIEVVADPRASTELAAVASCSTPPFNGGRYVACVRIWKSVDDEDRGGFVLSFSSQDTSEAFIPVAFASTRGTDIHLAGECEGLAFLKALYAALGEVVPR